MERRQVSGRNGIHTCIPGKGIFIVDSSLYTVPNFETHNQESLSCNHDYMEQMLYGTARVGMAGASKKNKTKGIFPVPGPAGIFLVLSSPKKSSPLVGILITTTICTFSQGLEQKKEEKKDGDGEASPAIVTGAFRAWREVTLSLPVYLVLGGKWGKAIYFSWHIS